MPVIEITSKAQFLDVILGSEDAIILDCYADWCGPCKAIAPKVEEWSDVHTGVKFYKVEVDKVPDVAQELGVRAMPTFMFFKGGQKVTEVVGANLPSIETQLKALVE